MISSLLTPLAMAPRTCTLAREEALRDQHSERQPAANLTGRAERVHVSPKQWRVDVVLNGPEKSMAPRSECAAPFLPTYSRRDFKPEAKTGSARAAATAFASCVELYGFLLRLRSHRFPQGSSRPSCH